jgi:uncharacterized protein YcbK (DUF882 family)
MEIASGPWPDFAYREIACKHCGNAVIVKEAMDKLQLLRDMMAQPLKINSAYRCYVHNKNVGGSDASKHLGGEAFDISTNGVDSNKLRACAETVGFTGFGTYATFLHVDIGPPREWTG